MKSRKETITRGLIIFLSCMILAGFASGSTYDSDSFHLSVVAEEISPEPVEPGQDITVKIRLINDGGNIAQNVSLKLDAKYPFFMKTETNNLDNKRSLCVGCSIDNTYYLVVDDNAKSGFYSLDFEISKDGLTINPIDPIIIKVVGKPDIVLETNQIDTNISSGDKFSIRFYAKNIGTGTARKIKIIPESKDILMLGSNIDLIDDISPGDTVSFDIGFIVKESLEPDTYSFPIRLEYVDEQGGTYDADFNIGVNILNRAEVALQSIKITPVSPTLMDNVHMEGIIENTGTGDADKVTVELTTSKGKIYKAFIGQLKSDDDAPFYFDVKPESVGTQTATLKVSYYDDFGVHSFETTIEKDVKKPTNNLIAVISVILVILVVSAFFFIRNRKNPGQK